VFNSGGRNSATAAVANQRLATQKWVRRSRPGCEVPGAPDPGTRGRGHNAGGKPSEGDHHWNCTDDDQVDGRVRCRTARCNAVWVVDSDAFSRWWSRRSSGTLVPTTEAVGGFGAPEMAWSALASPYPIVAVITHTATASAPSGPIH